MLWLLWIWIEPVATFHTQIVLNIKKSFLSWAVLIIGGKRKWSIRKETSIYVNLAWSGAALSNVETCLCYFPVRVNHWESGIYQGCNFQLAWPQMRSVKKDMKTKKKKSNSKPCKKTNLLFPGEASLVHNHARVCLSALNDWLFCLFLRRHIWELYVGFND